MKTDALSRLDGQNTLGYDFGNKEEITLADNEGHEDDEGRHDGGVDGDTHGREDGDPGGREGGDAGGRDAYVDAILSGASKLDIKIVNGIPLAPSASTLAKIH